MAKIKQNNFLDTVDEVFTSAKNAGVLHLYSNGSTFSGRTIQINGKENYHFGTTGYLGLEQDPRLKDAAIDAIDRYGTQFPLSKSYISHPLYATLEQKVEEMYDQPVIITKNSTLGHLAVIPTAIGDEDAVILDHQVHWSVQNATLLLKTRGVSVEMIRHNNLQMLEDKIKALAGKCRKIWYMADGVYSMYGDFAPVRQLMELANKYLQLHFYFDDVHGMSWNGKNGTGYVSSVLQDLPENVLLVGTLSKTFGASGAIAVSSNKKLHSKIKTFGGPLTFSAQLEPASVGAAIASADIHLSGEIYTLQAELQAKINHFNHLLDHSQLPLINRNNSPVFYIGTGMPISGYKFVQRLLQDGFYVNLGIYPAVPVKNTGVRITISRHNKEEDIEQLVQAMNLHYESSLEETGASVLKVKKAFKMPIDNVEEKQPLKEPSFSTIIEDSIEKIDKNEWNIMFSGKGILDWEGQLFLEKTFSNNEKREHNWEFKYIIVKDKDNVPVLATSLSLALWKDDLLAPASTSLKIEEQRKNFDPYFLTSPVLSTGSIFTEGEHIYVLDSHPNLLNAWKFLIDTVESIDHKFKISSMIVLRDFGSTNPYNSIFHDHGFMKVNMPESSIFSDFNWKTTQEFVNKLSRRGRRHFNKDIAPFENKFSFKVSQTVDKDLLIYMETLYENVRQNNVGLNTFPFPAKVFNEMNENSNWEFLLLYLKEEWISSDQPKLVGVMFCYSNCGKTYVPEFVGMDYRYAKDFNVYRQLLFKTISRAKELNVNQIDFGLTASFEKRKLGASVIPKVCYVQAKDNFSLELLEIMQNSR